MLLENKGKTVSSLQLLAALALTFGKERLAILFDPFSPVACASLTAPYVPGANVLSVVGVERYNVSVLSVPPTNNNITVSAICEVKVNLTHPGTNDNVLVKVWLPLSGWNGRFQGTGGGGFSTGYYDLMLGPAADAGWAAAMTDGGHAESPYDASTWALTSNRTLNWDLLIDFASRSLHDMTVVGKSITAQFYGSEPRYSYWMGCSTGGRQGFMEAQKYPEDYNGILANAPAINWPSLLVADQWPQIVMEQERTFPSACIFDAFTRASISKCDGLDGVIDGVIGNVQNCLFDPYELVGTSITCDEGEVSITTAMANVVRKILDGPVTTSGVPLWYGLKVGSVLTALANTVTTNGTTAGAPFSISDSWIKLFLEQNPDYNTANITYLEYETLFAKSNLEYTGVIATNNPDLSAFKAAGGKLISWHGLSDELIFPDGTLQYRQQVELEMGGGHLVDEFYRQFFPPGVYHCGMGPGPAPIDALSALVEWVEQGTAPDTLAAEVLDESGVVATRNICKYPLVSRYNGKGDTKSASSYTCATSFGPPARYGEQYLLQN